MPRITDGQLIAAVTHLEHRAFTVVEVKPDGRESMRLRFLITDEPGTFAVRLPLPSAHQLKPWLCTIPGSADDAAAMLADFLMEEIDTGCAHWASIAVEGPDRVFTIEPYGFRPADQARHRQLTKSAGSTGWWGWIQENDDLEATPDGRERTRLAALPYTYPEVGASAVGDLPAGYRHLSVERYLGTGLERFECAVERLMTWDMHRRAGLLVEVAKPHVTAGQGAVVSLLLGPVPIRAPVRVVDVVNEPAVQGFAYGTLPGHPESGEERFLVHHDDDDAVRATIRAFSRPARWFAKFGGPLTRRIQDHTTHRYLDALAAP